MSSSLKTRPRVRRSSDAITLYRVVCADGTIRGESTSPHYAKAFYRGWKDYDQACRLEKVEAVVTSARTIAGKRGGR